ncbi:hypothetical protein QN400_24025 [Pseudomonas sp. RTC3]|uniref:DUF6957 family protein n=1 Tax=Pseudomonas sp. 5C2 TaxID=3048588 RepID=UPI002AB48DF9|nr:hypothetical protein [Pseudomonas sp. 5C2]MDY7564721.1 hypothetical protein [Pseudomonas sp. 5C2]MEB0065077.1 hypothetical protein [Pseudomonas sp. RTC3]MEB0243719.1 hypothetical protein [Pseudomonas sp. 5C2]
MDIELLGDLLYGPARILYGSRLSDENLLEATHETFGAQVVCIVRNWMLIDVKLTGRHERLVKTNGLQPTLLYANKVVSANATENLSQGVLSGFQYRYEDCFFASDDMLYVLGGRGSRKSAEVPAVFALSQQCGGEFRVDDGR